MKAATAGCRAMQTYIELAREAKQVFDELYAEARAGAAEA